MAHSVFANRYAARFVKPLNLLLTFVNSGLTKRCFIFANQKTNAFLPMQKLVYIFFITILFLSKTSIAQSVSDTTELTFSAAEKIFLQNNLSLLANKYNVDINKVLIKQAKLWDNPILSTDQNIYDGKFFQHNSTGGQVYVQVMQLIKTAGKRSKAAQIATDNTVLAQQQFDDLLRTLRYTLQNDFLEISHLLEIKKVYTGEIGQVSKLANSMDILLQAGNVSLKDNLRIKALLFSLENELVNTDAQLLSTESEIKLLLNNNETKFIAPKVDYKFAGLTTATLPTIDTLLAQALINRPDAKIAQTTLALQNHNLTYQKALGKPDVSIGTEYDQRSSYANNYVGLAISLPLNIFNRNQGYIDAAKFSILQQQAVVNLTNAGIKNDITTAASKFTFYQNINNRQQLDFSQQYDKLFNNMLNSYQQRQMSLLEFIDFIDAYKDTKLKLVEQHNQLIHAAQDLNFAVGNDVVQLN